MSKLPPPEEELVPPLEEILDQSVAQIIRHEDPGRYLDWMRTSGARFLAGLGGEDAPNVVAAAVMLGRSIWNVTPLPGNHFKPKPLPEPGRNDPCPCGSGRKYKQCCAQAPRFEALSTEDIWPVMVAHLSPAQLDAALASHRVPPHALAGVAEDYLDDGQFQKAVRLLEPMFAGDLSRLDERYEPAFDTLVDAYQELGHDRKRTEFAERVAREAGGPLRRAAYQRLAAIRHDRGEIDAAWAAMRGAQQADPGHPSLAFNEITLLLAERREDEARARAKFWAAKLTREDYPDQDLIDSLETAARDPGRVVADLHLGAMGVELDPVRRWLDHVERRALPDYEVRQAAVLDAADPEAVRTAAREQLSAMGIPPAQMQSMVEMLARDLVREHKGRERGQSQSKADASAPQADLFGPALDAEAGDVGDQPPHELRPAAPHTTLEGDWHQVFPCDKPSLTELVPADVGRRMRKRSGRRSFGGVPRRPTASTCSTISPARCCMSNRCCRRVQATDWPGG